MAARCDCDGTNFTFTETRTDSNQNQSHIALHFNFFTQLLVWELRRMKTLVQCDLGCL